MCQTDSAQTGEVSDINRLANRVQRRRTRLTSEVIKYASPVERDGRCASSTDERLKSIVIQINVFRQTCIQYGLQLQMRSTESREDGAHGG